MPPTVGTGPSSTGPRRGRVPAHNRREIAEAAVTLADRDGLGAVTMRSVAQSLGTGPASLYRYLSTRDELLALMVDEVNAEFGLHGPDDRPWLDQMLDLAHEARTIYRRHPWMVEALSTTPALGPNGYAYLEHTLAVLAPTQASGGTMLEAVAVFNALVRLLSKEPHHGQHTGETLSARILPADGLTEPAASTVPFPHLTAALADAGPHDDQFDRVLRRVLGGLLSR